MQCYERTPFETGHDRENLSVDLISQLNVCLPDSRSLKPPLLLIDNQYVVIMNLGEETLEEIL